jgi:membrane-associated HD superfamily phosphohydrolase
MKLGDLKKIKEALAKELEGIYQRRVDYDEAKSEKKTTKKKKKETEDDDEL